MDKLLVKKVLLFILSVIVCIFTAYKHEMWGDEAQAFLLARDSESFSALFQNIAYEGHPALWHVLIKISMRAIPQFYVLQVLNTLFAIGIFALIYFGSPYRLFEKFLAASSYYISYEWGIISRNYALGVFLLLLAIVLYEKMQHDRKYIFIGIVLCLAINSSAHAMIIALFLAAYIYLQGITCTTFKDIFKGKKLIGIIFILLGIAIYLLQTYPPPDRLGEEKNKTARGSFTEKANYSLKNLSKGYFFVQRSVDDQPMWQNDLMSNKFTNRINVAGETGSEIFYLFAGIIAFVLIFIFLSQWQTKLFYAGTTLLLAAAGYASPYGLSLRHCGFYFLVFFIAAWLDRRVKTDNRKLNIVLIFILLLQFISSVSVHSAEWKQPFSNAERTAHYITENHLEHLSMAGHFWQTSPVIAYTGTDSIYILESRNRVSFIKLDSMQVNYIGGKQMSAEAVADASIHSGAELLLLQPGDSSKQLKDAGYKLIQNFDMPSLQWYEKYALYRKVNN